MMQHGGLFFECRTLYSIMDRLMKRYYDRALSDFEIGWGQQFYVWNISMTTRIHLHRRMKLLYLTDKAVPAARRIKEIHRSFYNTLCFDMPLSDIQQTEQTMQQMMENINQKVWHRMEDSHGA